MISFFATLVFLREYIKNKFGDKDYHSIYRSFYCFLITIMCSLYGLSYYKYFAINPYYSDGYSYVINTVMIAYMIYDIIYFFYSYKFRYDLLFHHIISLIGFICYRKYFFITFCCIAEIISSLNWLYLINEKFTNIVKVFRGLSILLVRIPLWIGILQVFYPINKLICFGILIFIFLDIFWLYIIYINFKNNVNFIKYDKKNTVNLRKNVKNTIKNTFNNLEIPPYYKKNKKLATSDKIMGILNRINKNNLEKSNNVINNNIDNSNIKYDLDNSNNKYDLDNNIPNDNNFNKNEYDSINKNEYDSIKNNKKDNKENKSSLVKNESTVSIKHNDNNTNKSYKKPNKSNSSINDNDSIIDNYSSDMETSEVFDTIFKDIVLN